MRYFSLIILVSLVSVPAIGQRDTARVSVNVSEKNVPRITLNARQQQWLDLNYKKIAILPQDSALQFVKINFPRTAEQNAATAEATYEYLISQAARMSKADNSSQLVQMQKALQALKGQKKTLMNQIGEKEEELSTTRDPQNRKKLEKELAQLRSQLAFLQTQIKEKEEAIRELD